LKKMSEKPVEVVEGFNLEEEMSRRKYEAISLPFSVKPYRIQMDCGAIVEAVLTRREVESRVTWCPYHGDEGFRVLVRGEAV